MTQNSRTSRFEVEDIVILTHSVCGLLENMKVVVSKATKDDSENIEVETTNGKCLSIKTKYLDVIKPSRVSKELSDGDTARVTRHYGRFTEGSHVTVLSDYLGTNNKVVVSDERGKIGAISKDLLIKI